MSPCQAPGSQVTAPAVTRRMVHTVMLRGRTVEGEPLGQRVSPPLPWEDGREHGAGKRLGRPKDTSLYESGKQADLKLRTGGNQRLRSRESDPHTLTISLQSHSLSNMLESIRSSRSRPHFSFQRGFARELTTCVSTFFLNLPTQISNRHLKLNTPHT